VRPNPASTVFNLALGFALAAIAGCASVPDEPQPSPQKQAAASSPSIPISIIKPDGDGPFPAVVILHDCSGLGPRSSGSPRRWADILVKQGYVIAIPDSFSTRGFESGVCTDAASNRVQVAPARRVGDAFEALAYLRAQPFVDGAHVGVMGGSHGGATTVLTIGTSRSNGFAAAVALYPGCNPNAPYHAEAPLLILSGELDDWTPAAPCERLARGATGAPVRIKVYPGAHHSFDNNSPVRYVPNRVNQNAPGGRGATTGGNAAAWADSIREVEAFFAQHLRTR
jgi:dienelactone hydrolase